MTKRSKWRLQPLRGNFEFEARSLLLQPLILGPHEEDPPLRCHQTTHHQSRNSQWKILQDEISHSLKKQMKLENITNESNSSFNKFKEEYYSS